MRIFNVVAVTTVILTSTIYKLMPILNEVSIVSKSQTQWKSERQFLQGKRQNENGVAPWSTMNSFVLQKAQFIVSSPAYNQ